MTTADGAPSLGVSLQLQDGDLAFDSGAGTLLEVEELDALSQALELSIQTQLGTDRINSTFGFDRLAVGAYALGLSTRKQYIAMQLVACVGADQRVRDVREVFFSDDPRFFELQPGLDATVQAEIVAQIRASREYTVYVVIETITSQTLTISSGGTLA
jgi:hypothetical protein